MQLLRILLLNYLMNLNTPLPNIFMAPHDHLEIVNQHSEINVHRVKHLVNLSSEIFHHGLMVLQRPMEPQVVIQTNGCLRHMYLLLIGVLQIQLVVLVYTVHMLYMFILMHFYRIVQTFVPYSRSFFEIP